MDRRTILLSWLWGLSLCTVAWADDPAASSSLPAQLDHLLVAELPGAALLAAPADDLIFQRRVSLDLVGRIPTPAEITAFALDPASDKRDQYVARLLANEEFGRNWGRYWRDVILYRRTEDRAFIAAAALEEFLTGALNENKSWDQVAQAFITAEGDVQENGATGLIMAQAGQPEEIVSEISRIFLGIQIQCAQCHDHKTDRWKREEFHQLAAFLPRVAVRQDRSTDRIRFLVSVNDRTSFRPRNANARFIGTLEHRMPDLEDPQAPGTLMQPVFFLTGQEVSFGTPDAVRREKLAQWVTSRDNEWFAKACVNRIWAELVGEGFYEPVDDMGPDRSCSAPQTLDCLAAGFAGSGYDMKWLFRTIIATQAYQRQSQSRRNPGEPPFAANCPQRLRGDQLFDALLSALDLPEPGGLAGRGPMAPGYRRLGSPRMQFNFAFGYDPSDRRDEVAGSIPQALLLMNSPVFSQAIDARRSTGLGRLLAEIKSDEALVEELYLKTLAREPTGAELSTCLAYVREVGSRAEAFEDLLWSLVNSTEFLHRR